jgi:hypothetical protein
MSTRYFSYTALLAAVVLSCVTVSAEESGALGVKLGAGSRLLLSLDTGIAYYDNYYYQPDNEESAIGLLVKPSADIFVDRGELRYSVSAGAVMGAFDLEGDEDDYLDTSLDGKFDWSPLTRHRFKGGIYRLDDHDPFGTRRTEGTSSSTAKLDEWTQTGANLIYRFGAPEAKFNLEGEVRTMDREYTTNRDTTRFLDHDTDTLRGSVFYNLSSKTTLVAEIITADINYDDAPAFFPSRAGDLARYRVGAIWLPTGKTEADVRIGTVDREFDSDVQEDYSEFDWQIGVSWSPRPRDVLRLTTGREPEESYINAASLIDNQFATLTWTHDWTALLKTKVSYGYNDLDFRNTARQDELQSLAFGVDYMASRRWSVFGQLSLSERDSNVEVLDFETMVFTTGIRLNY